MLSILNLIRSVIGSAVLGYIGTYLGAVRKRFGQWILDTGRADYSEAWLAWQDEIGRRHHCSGKNKVDGVCAAPRIPLRHVPALVVSISITMKPFLAKKGTYGR